VALAESGTARVDVLARDLPGETPTAWAPVPWLPAPARFGEDGTRWARQTREHLSALADQPRTGVLLADGRLFPAESGPAGAVQRISAPVVWPADYLDFLARRLLAADGTLTRLSLPVLPPRGLVVNCTGLAARALVPDLQVEPQTRQLLRLANPGLTGWLAGGDLSVVTERDPATVTVVGTLPPGAADPDGAGLVARAGDLDPLLAGAGVLDRRLAAIAHRPTVQLVTRHEGERTVVHCYGHGSSAVALSWGCAQDVVARLSALEEDQTSSGTGVLW
jgi:D-amino-acid oxidase